MIPSTSYRMPAEWEPHEAVWIAWPHHEPDWPGKLEPIPWVYAEIVRVLHRHERVEILCNDEAVKAQAESCLRLNGVDAREYRLHIMPTDRVWLRDSGPMGVRTSDGRAAWVRWQFNAWAKYDNYLQDEHVPEAIQRVTGREMIDAVGSDGKRFVLEGGAIDVDGQGTLLTTEECLLSDVQARNPGVDRAAYETMFAQYLGVQQTIWLGRGCAGDDTHGHVDDVARFVGPGTVVLSYEADPADENHEASVDNLRRLKLARNAHDQNLRVIKLPMPRPVIFDGQRLPASYANFYIANGVVLVPTFTDVNDRTALNTLAELFPDREVVGIPSVDLVWGLGTLHCMTQQQPRALSL